MKQITYNGVNIQVQDGPEDTKLLVIAEPPIGVHIFPLPQDIAHQIGAALKGEEVVALPPKPKLVVPNAA